VKTFTALFLALTMAAFAEPPNPGPNPKKLPSGVRLAGDLAYVPDGTPAQRLDLYLPEQPADKPLPLVVHIHGGGWRGGNKYPCPIVGLVSKGYAVASVEYRFSQQALFPAQIQDCQAALRWLRANSKKYGLDAERIGVTGSSAGGHLSALVGTAGGKKVFPPIGGNEDHSDRVKAVCDFYGPKNFRSVMQQADEDKNVANVFRFNTSGDPYSSLTGSNLSDSAKSDTVSPIFYVGEDCPPFLILHGTHDALVPYAQSVEFADRLKAKGIPVWLQTLPGSGHGGPGFSKPALHALILAFFDKHLKGSGAPIQLVPEADLAVEPPAPK
jgi:acetyl esterase/lipase